MESNVPGHLVGSEIHGFRTMEDLDIRTVMDEAKSRWLRPNEIHAILCNSKYFSINVKPINLPQSGTIVLFDRKVLRNFRKDGHNWKKKKDGKTVKEAHEHLKVGNVERIHVYYAHGEDNPTFVRRCYWLLDKTMENVVLVHYRETQEPQASPATPVYSNSSSGLSDPTPTWPLSEESSDSMADPTKFINHKGQLAVASNDHEKRLHEINTLDWDELLVPGNPKEDNTLSDQDGFGIWMESVLSGNSPVHDPFENHSFTHTQIFNITDISPTWAFSTEQTKILVVGTFNKTQQHLSKSDLFCVCGNECVPVETIQFGVYSCIISPQVPGLVNLYITFDGLKPISQHVTFEFRPPLVHNVTVSEENFNIQDFKAQARLTHLLFSTSMTLNILSNEVTSTNLNEAKIFAKKTVNISDNLTRLMKSVDENKVSFVEAKDSLFEFTLQNRVREWLIERIIQGCKISERDEQGQGVIHLCAMLGYSWAVYPFSLSSLSLDYRDKFGWTALHWAAHSGRQKMVATLLSAGAKSYLVTDPTSANPGGYTPADLASKNGYEGLAAYLAEKALIEHFTDMKLAGNATNETCSKSRDDDSSSSVNPLSEEMYLKDSLAAYRSAAEAAARINAAFRENSLKLRTKAVESSNPEYEARNIVAAMKIQHAFRNFELRKTLSAAARIQYRFRTWKMRRKYLHMRSQAIKIQAAFRGFHVRRHYGKILWSVGVLEKAILRWRLRRKGFRGLQVESQSKSQAGEVRKQQGEGEGDDVEVVEEDFFQASRKQAEERIERSVVKVQAMFRSKRAQEEYRRIKEAHNKAMAEYQLLQDPDDVDMGGRKHD